MVHATVNGVAELRHSSTSGCRGNNLDLDETHLGRASLTTLTYAALYASMWSGLKSLPIKNLEFSMRNNLDISQRHRSRLPIKGLSCLPLPTDTDSRRTS